MIKNLQNTASFQPSFNNRPWSSSPSRPQKQVIRGLLDQQKFVIAVEHDLSVLDYLSDFICCLYGKPGAYGVVTLPFSVREGINIFLAGWLLFVCSCLCAGCV